MPVKLQSEFTGYNREKDARIVSMDGDEVTASRGRPRLPTGEGVLPIRFIWCFCVNCVPTKPRVAVDAYKIDEKEKSIKFSVFIDIFFLIFLHCF